MHLVWFRCPKPTVRVLLSLEAKAEEEKVERNLDDLEKVGFPSNVFYSPLDLNFYNIVLS